MVADALDAVDLRWGDSANAQLEAMLRFENTPHAITTLVKAQSLRQPKSSAQPLRRPVAQAQLPADHRAE